ncbi:hypothetical protein CYMTET_35475, partial [Cymbomonas tetramitiformis]
ESAALYKLLVGDEGASGGSWAVATGAQPLVSPLRPAPDSAAQETAAAEMERRLMRGDRTGALKAATAGGLWGPAMLLARHCGEQCFQEVAKEMAQQCCVHGTPMRSVLLVMGGNPGEVHKPPLEPEAPSEQQALGVGMGVAPVAGDAGASSHMLASWRENLAMLVASHAAMGEEAVITELGDLLWKARGQPVAAHLCYLLSGVALQAYAPGARLCLLGADHIGRPRTYATPFAIQRTELYERIQMLVNPQALLAEFQPYKLVYAQMLAEEGRLVEALKYVGALQQALKGARHAHHKAAVHHAAVLEERLQQRDALLGGNPLAHGGRHSAAGGAGWLGGFARVLDRGITSLMGEEEGDGAAGTHPPVPAAHHAAGAGGMAAAPPQQQVPAAPTPAAPGGSAGAAVSAGGAALRRSQSENDAARQLQQQASSAKSPPGAQVGVPCPS